MKEFFFSLLEKVNDLLPPIKAPTYSVSPKERLAYTLIILFLFFVFGSITIFGVKSAKGREADLVAVITATRFGTLLTIGIGPIILASIFMQLFIAGDIIKIDFSTHSGRERYQKMQRGLAILLIAFEAFVFASSIHSNPSLLTLPPGPFTLFLIWLQIALASLFLLYFDEIITKYGIGSGISLFIAAGVASVIVIRGFHILVEMANTLSSPTAFTIPKLLIKSIPILTTLLTLFVVVYFERMRVRISLSHQSIVAGRDWNIKFLYLSNLPVIFASALIINIQLLSVGISHLAYSNPELSFLRILADTGSNVSNRLQDGLFYLLTPPRVLDYSTMEPRYDLLLLSTPFLGIPEWLHAIVYVVMLSLLSLFFGRLWAEMVGMDAKSIAEKLSEAGMMIRGMRANKILLERQLERIIKPLIDFSSIFVGLLAGFADLLGVLGSGTGLLLSVSILVNYSQLIERYGIVDVYPWLRKWLK